MNNEYVLKVLMSCRTLSQLKACKHWVLNTYYVPEGEEKTIGWNGWNKKELYDAITSMEIYIRRPEFNEVYEPSEFLGDIISF